jgi:dolichol-phosphate mannosyltransferase
METTPEPLERLPLPLSPRATAARPRLAVVLPAYNEAELIPRVCDELARVLETLPVCWTLLFVNDGSGDASYQVLEAMHQRDPRIGHLTLSRSFGHQAALAAGLDSVDSDLVVTMDSDLQHPPSLLPALFSLWQKGYDVVHARKTDTVGLPLWRRATTSLAYGLISWIARTPIVPNTADFRLLDAAVVSTLRTLPEAAPLHRGLVPWLGFRQCVVQYVAGERPSGASKYTLRQFAALFGRALFDFPTPPFTPGSSSARRRCC